MLTTPCSEQRRCSEHVSLCQEHASSSPALDDCTAGTLQASGNAPDPAAAFHILYQEQKRRKRVLGWRRTHKDPFEWEWEQILSWLVANPERSSGDIFRELQRRSPGRYHPLQIRTLQPGMRKIRAYLLETREEQWQAEVIRGPSPRQLNKPPRKIFGEATQVSPGVCQNHAT